MKRKVLMGLYEAVMAAQEASTEAVLALIRATILLAGDAIDAGRRVAETVMPQQLIQRALTKHDPFQEFHLDFFSGDSELPGKFKHAVTYRGLILLFPLWFQ
jgi:hypothetical protein